MTASARTEAAPSERLADIRVLTPVSVVIPTYKERENLPLLVERLDRLRNDYDLELEVLVVDDDSRDGSVEWVEHQAPEWVRIIVRTTNRGLSPSVVEGLREATHPVLVVMDADLSHPPEKIPNMILALESGQQFVIGSRYVPGGSTDDEWGFFRWLNSKVATLLARPFTDAKDPMAGFFAMRKTDFEQADALNPVGYKIGLELIVKCGIENVGEVPIHFTDRRYGESKLNFKEQLNYLRHLRRLYIYKYATWSSFVQFAAVGLSGVFVNLAVLTLLLALGSGENLALIGGIAVSIVTNFLLNRRFSFSYARDENPYKQFMGFVLASSAGAFVQFAVARIVLTLTPSIPVQAAALFGIAAGMGFNFLVNRYLVFKQKY